MGFRLRKSLKAGLVRVNFSKSGVGYSFGGKGFRVTKKAGGGVRTTSSIAGTGISYSQDFGGHKKHSTVKKSNRPADSTELLLCLLLGWLGVHKFYAGKIGMGILYLCTFGLFGIGWIVDAIMCICNFNR